MNDLLAVEWFRKRRVDAATVRQVAKESDKCRFTIDWTDGTEYVRANQGHSNHRLELAQNYIKLEGPQHGFFIHGTLKEHWKSIQHQGIRMQGRKYVHGGPEAPWAATTGARHSSELAIYVSLKGLMEAGAEVYRSEGGALVTQGVGLEVYGLGRFWGISPSLFSRVVDCRTKAAVWDPARASSATETPGQSSGLEAKDRPAGSTTGQQ